MEVEGVALPAPLIDVEPAPPATGAEEQKPKDAPASEADAQNPETPEQQEAKRESRRARSNARKAAELAAARTEARMLREQLERTQRQGSQQDSGEPQRDNFQDYESYLEARADWRADQKVQSALKADREASQKQAEQAKVTERHTKIAQQWVEREKVFQSATSDYEEVVQPYVEEDLGRLSDVARQAIVDSDVGPQLIYHLASNPDEAERIAELSPHRQAVELGKLEVSLAAPAPKVSKAPAPIKHVGQGRSAPAGYSENMSDAEYEALRKSQGARWAQR